MPLLYGEGNKASKTKTFILLQHGIIRQSQDASIFEWEENFLNFTRPWSPLSGALRSSVRNFKLCADVKCSK